MGNKILEKFKHLPQFADGRINYTTSDIAPVVTVFVEYEGKILLLKRSDKVRTYRGLWNTVAGYIDEELPVEEIACKEVKEELGVGEDVVESIKLGENFEIYDKEIDKTWIIFPAQIKLNYKPKIKLDWEHSEYLWIKPGEICNYDTVYKLAESLSMVL